jgi:hypothetical protein
MQKLDARAVGVDQQVIEPMLGLGYVALGERDAGNLGQ